MVPPPKWANKNKCRLSPGLSQSEPGKTASESAVAHKRRSAAEYALDDLFEEQQGWMYSDSSVCFGQTWLGLCWLGMEANSTQILSHGSDFVQQSDPEVYVQKNVLNVNEPLLTNCAIDYEILSVQSNNEKVTHTWFAAIRLTCS